MDAHDGGNAYLLGEMNAMLRTMAEDLKAMRSEIGDIARRQTETDLRVTRIETDRAAMLPDYQKFVHRVSNHLMSDQQWKADFAGQLKGADRATKLWSGGVKVAIALAGFLMGGLGYKLAIEPKVETPVAAHSNPHIPGKAL